MGKYGISFILCARREGLSVFRALFYWLDCKKICPSSADCFVYSLISTQAILSQPPKIAAESFITLEQRSSIAISIFMTPPPLPPQTIFGKGRNTEEEISSLCRGPQDVEMLFYVLYTLSTFYKQYAIKMLDLHL